jgi:undecaprenyl-diphosphatase
MLGLREPELLLDCALHFGTLLAVCIYFRSDLRGMAEEARGLFSREPRAEENSGAPKEGGPFLPWVLAGTLPTVGIGLFFRAPLERLFGSVHAVGAMLILTGAILAATLGLSGRASGRNRLGLFTALAVGTAQGMALIPGISRSGITIVCGMLCGLKGDLAARFSFLLSIPAILGALSLQLYAEGIERAQIMPLFMGLMASGSVGYGALKILMGVVRKGRLYCFAPYCWAAGLLILLLVD